MNGIPNVRHHDVCTCAKCNAKANRIAAFGAIRRAAAHARTSDSWDPYHGHLIREAIRAAIASDKA